MSKEAIFKLYEGDLSGFMETVKDNLAAKAQVAVSEIHNQVSEQCGFIVESDDKDDDEEDDDDMEDEDDEEDKDD